MSSLKLQSLQHCYLFPKRQISDFSRLKEFADDNFKIEENGRKFFKRVEDTVGNEEIARYSVFKRLVLQTRKNQGLFGRGIRLAETSLAQI